ncbi:hypothetical protein COB55_02205 [Candidatus Wolfebacteria bacterium]|nr:MAG: hypothetical protein COB55_02205 [Candidatus Wolfebacteria bacterium]
MEIGTDLEKSSFLSPVKNIAIFMFLVGVVHTLYSILLIYLFGARGLIVLAIGISLIVISRGLKKYKRWGLYSYTILAIGAIISYVHSIVIIGIVDKVEIATLVGIVLLLAYLWKISKRFS